MAYRYKIVADLPDNEVREIITEDLNGGLLDLLGECTKAVEVGIFEVYLGADGACEELDMIFQDVLQECE